MALVINCDCGYASRGNTEEELLKDARTHIADAHPDLVGKVSSEDLLAMAEEQ